jgi:primosomal protein N'
MAKGKRYSVSYDKEQAKRINKILLSYPYITQNQLCKACITNAHRLKYLEQQGLIKLRRKYEQRTTAKYTQISELAAKKICA